MDMLPKIEKRIFQEP